MVLISNSDSLLITVVQPHFTPPMIPTLSPQAGSHAPPSHQTTPFHDGHLATTHTKHPGKSEKRNTIHFTFFYHFISLWRISVNVRQNGWFQKMISPFLCYKNPHILIILLLQYIVFSIMLQVISLALCIIQHNIILQMLNKVFCTWQRHTIRNYGSLHSSVCRPRWSDWMNTHHPGDPGSTGDHEPSAAEFAANYHFCNGGNITKVECYSVSMEAPAESSGEILVCTPSKGLVCDDSDNFPIPCGDYKIRYYCDCGTSNHRK